MTAAGPASESGYYVPKSAWVTRWWTCPPIGSEAFWRWCCESRPPIQVEEPMGDAAARRLAQGHSPARTRKYIAWKFPTWSHLAGELVDAVVFAAEARR